MQYTITLADGRKLTGLGKNGDNFVSSEKVDETIFKDNLSVMTVSDGKTETVYHNAELIQQQEWFDGSWYLAFRELTESEQKEKAVNAKLQEIEKTLDTINKAFLNLFDNLFADTAMDISTDISVLRTMLAQEGLTDSDFNLNRN